MYGTVYDVTKSNNISRSDDCQRDITDKRFRKDKANGKTGKKL